MILVLGASGKLGTPLVRLLRGRGELVLTPTHRELDLHAVARDPLVLKSWLDGRKPSVVINCAAYNFVDRAESEPDLCFALNAQLPLALGQYCAQAASILVHFSSDYVFSGKGEVPYVETDTLGPLSAYGRAKAQADQWLTELIQNENLRAVIFRVSWLYASSHACFSELMLRHMMSGESIRVVSDQVGTPSYVSDLADLVLHALDRVQRDLNFQQWGIYHLALRGHVSREGFVRKMQDLWFEDRPNAQKSTIQGMPSVISPGIAQRPLNSRFDLSCFISTFLEGRAELIPTWQEGLMRYLKERP